MFEQENVSLGDIKRCIICNNQVSCTVICQNSDSCNFKIITEDCKSQLCAYANNSTMKFCYTCGVEVEREDDLIVCGSSTCSDPIKFKVPSKVLIAAKDVKHCVLCAGVMETKSSGKMYCSSAKCKFRIANTDNEKVTNNLQDYSINGKMKFCYTCGCSIRVEGRYTVCSSHECGSARLESISSDKQPAHSNGGKHLESTKDTKVTANDNRSASQVVGPQKPYQSRDAMTGKSPVGNGAMNPVLYGL